VDDDEGVLLPATASKEKSRMREIARFASASSVTVQILWITEDKEALSFTSHIFSSRLRDSTSCVEWLPKLVNWLVQCAAHFSLRGRM